MDGDKLDGDIQGHSCHPYVREIYFYTRNLYGPQKIDEESHHHMYI